jgi:hypothetical protein
VLAVTGLALLAIATILYFVTLFLYDELLMPTRFWPTRLPEVRGAWNSMDVIAPGPRTRRGRSARDPI